jgi:putative membrane-bound dehydrogenase-like protein
MTLACKNPNLNMKRTIGSLLILSVAIAFSCMEKRYDDPLEPEQAIKSFHLPDGFRIELFASEPQVMDPVDMVFDEEGNAFVVEMPDYPFKPENGKGTGRIKMLQDTDGDGKIDKATVFADSILDATTMLPWKGGLLVTAAPNILYLKDTDGDFRADTREILFTGFFQDNSEAQITSLTYGIDNWIYAANNGQAGTVYSKARPDAPPLDMAGSDFRFRPDRGEFELETGNAQFGLTLDDWGHRFITQNTIHIRQVVIPWRYLHRHPNLRSASPLTNISDHDLEMFQVTPPPYWRAERTRRRQKQYAEEHLDRVEYAEDHFTGSSGGMVYGGDAFPRAYYGNVFTGDVSGNLVHRDVLWASDTTPVYVAKRDGREVKSEFLSSSDPCFRPASFAVGPDGALYVVDMYRQHIETPVSIPEDLKADMDFLNGSDRGRIYRIVPTNFEVRRVNAPKLRERSSSELVKLLSHESRWWRQQAQRLLVERQDASVVPALEKVFTEHPDPRARLHALYTLEGLNALTVALVSRAVTDSHEGVRAQGLILAERYQQLLPEVLTRLHDPSIQVVLQATLSAGQFSHKDIAAELAQVLETNGRDPWIQLAVLSSVAGSSPELVEYLAKHDFFKEPEEWKTALVEDFSFAVGKSNQREDVHRLLNLLKRPALDNAAWRRAVLKGLSNGMAKAETLDAALKEFLKEAKADSDEQVRASLSSVDSIYNGK